RRGLGILAVAVIGIAGGARLARIARHGLGALAGKAGAIALYLPVGLGEDRGDVGAARLDRAAREPLVEHRLGLAGQAVAQQLLGKAHIVGLAGKGVG